MFQSLILSNRGDMQTAILRNDSLTHLLTNTHTVTTIYPKGSIITKRDLETQL